MQRIVWGVFSVICIIAMPWWVSFLVIVAGIVIFPVYVEGILFASIMDLVYGVPLVRFHAVPFVMTLVTLSIFVGTLYGKKIFRT